MSLTLRMHEMAGDTSHEEAGLMKQQSRIEAAGRLRRGQLVDGERSGTLGARWFAEARGERVWPSPVASRQ